MVFMHPKIKYVMFTLPSVTDRMHDLHVAVESVEPGHRMGLVGQ